MLKVASAVVLGALTYEGTWDASTNNPYLTSGVGVKNQYYVVSVAGNTDLDGITIWNVGDWAIFNGTVWERIVGSQTASFSNLTVTSLTGYMYANGSNLVTASTTIPVGNVSGAVPNTVYVIAGTNLSGGGELTGNVTINNPYNGTVSNVATGTGLTGGPITSTGTISLSNTTVSAGTYGSVANSVTLTVNQQGQITNISNTGIQITVANVSGAVPNTVNILTGSGLTGGGALTGNLTLVNTGVTSFNSRNAAVTLTSTDVTTALGYTPGTGNGSVTSITAGTGLSGGTITTSGTINISNTAVVAGSYGNASTVATYTVNQQGQLTAAGNVTISIPASQVSGAVPNTRQILTGTGLTGGGNLASDLTLSVVANSTNQNVTTFQNGVIVASQPAINFAPSNNVNITVGNDSTNNRANVVVSLTGIGTMAYQNSNSVNITGGSINVQTTNLTATTASTATFATSSLPLVPAGYLELDLNGTTVKVPYYAV